MSSERMYLPNMNDGIILHFNTIVKDFLPDNVTIFCWIGADNVEQLLDVDRFQFVIVSCHVPLLHER